ncbi:MAG: hypothetical protein QM673_12630 [Gordonia sp. (in: high G+C Gram-positive bacteria)]
MNRGPAALHRVTAAISATVFLGIGVGALLWQGDVGPVREWTAHLDATWLSRTAATGWWTVVLVGIALIAAIWSWSLLWTAIRGHKVDDVVLAGSNRDGSLYLPPKLLAKAVAADLADEAIVSDVAGKAVGDRGRKIIRLTVTASPTYSYDTIAAILAPRVRQIQAAVAGSGAHVQALIHISNPGHMKNPGR